MMYEKRCAYCGVIITKRSDNHVDHVFPKCLYSSADPNSKIQRLTVNFCKVCNTSWQDDEVHFRNMLVLVGDPVTKERRDIWKLAINRSFDKEDGFRRLNDMFNTMKPVEIEGKQRHKVYLAEDDRVMRVVRKIIRGLSHHH